jgi:hypothetical protein
MFTKKKCRYMIFSRRSQLALENEERVNHCEYFSDIYWTDLTSTLSLSPTPTGEFKHM